MALPLANLDNRTYDELLEEGRRVIRGRPSAWTDHNVHDPGITLLELFTWRVEQDIYRLDRTPEASIRAFLRLVGIDPLPPRVARTVLELGLPDGNGPVTIPAGLVVGNGEGTVVFQTAMPVYVAAAGLAAVGSLDGATGIETDHTAANVAPDTTYRPLGSAPAPEDALMLRFDPALEKGGGPITLYVWSADPEADARTRTRLMEFQERIHGERGGKPGCNRADRAEDWRRHYSARTCWEFQRADGNWAELQAVEDETRALTLSGFVRFQAPQGSAVQRIRSRLVTGHYECPPVIGRIGLNTVAAEHAVQIDANETLGSSNGQAGQVFNLGQTPVVAGSVRVTATGIEDRPWRDQTHWDRVGPHDPILMLDPASGRVSFGDGRVGRVPPAGADLICRYRIGGGPDGNVPRGTLSKDAEGQVAVTQPFPAFGGKEAETLEQARERALDFLAHRERAVTLDDFETLAVATPGVPVARVRALAGYHPALPCLPAAGCVTVVAVPRCPDDRPLAGPDFLAAVNRWLQPRCPLTTELHVIGPCYQVVGVTARLNVQPGVDPATLSGMAINRLERFFHPLSGGPDGMGWPVGRHVYRSEVMALLNAIDGVNYVDDFSMAAEGAAEPSCTNIQVCPDCLAASGQHRITVTERSDVP